MTGGRVFRDSPIYLESGKSSSILEWDFRDGGEEEVVLAPGEMAVIKTENSPTDSLFWFAIRWAEL